MIDILGLVAIGFAAAFVSSNIDDLFILSYQIILGQYIGMGSLMSVSLVGSLITLVIPRNLIGLIGLFPIVMRIKELLESHKEDSEEEQQEQVGRPRMNILITVLATTIATNSLVVASVSNAYGRTF